MVLLPAQVHLQKEVGAGVVSFVIEVSREGRKNLQAASTLRTKVSITRSTSTHSRRVSIILALIQSCCH